MKVLFLVTIVSCACALPPPNYVIPCHEKGNDESCAITQGDRLIAGVSKGDKTFNIPRLDPLSLPLVELLTPNLEVRLKDVTVKGITNGHMTKFNVDKKRGLLQLHLDRIEITGPYNVNGKILLLPITGDGQANITGVGGDYTFTCEFETLTKSDGKTYMRMVNDKMDYKLERAYFHFTNLFNGDEKLGAETNRFLNENWDQVLLDIGGTIRSVISNIFTSIVGNVFEKVPQDELFIRKS